ncbi:glycosyltransferase family 2 protein [Geomesophilobacter sediminis]|uniref:Glycosyltransferase family 2 protein n=1 Tax=Geomesophilobacter sediminis TaxID=2798584 RepID=A0A8J7LUX4_9BACT|nr:glycosyltransferase family A protein [Geomesophilobacter sediminis]MBJ6724270.1 glycosyltransferase family 2 protein [Geomesophilobacter sediminis]
MTIEGVSFIVIARNEEFGVRKCLAALAALPTVSCEVICVDSGSRDGTVEVMRDFLGRVANLKIMVLDGYSNASVARNVGLRQASGEIVFFLDGDVEVDPEFIAAGVACLRERPGGITGKLRELQYSRDYSRVLKEVPDRFHIRGEGRIYACGGCFMASREALLKTGFFDERLERSQDYDFTLRLSRRYPLLGIPVSMGTHHTVGYDDRQRLSTHLAKFQALFFGCALRKNLANLRGILWLLSRRERGIALGALTTVAGAMAIAFFGTSGAVALAALMTADLAAGWAKGEDGLYRIYLHYLYPAGALVGALHIPDRRRPYTVREVAP